MAESTLWWLLAGTAVAVELLTGTFYLLMVAIGLVAGAMAAHAGMGVSVQLIVAALVGGGAVAAWSQLRAKPAGGPAGSNRDVNLDVGETVQVKSWHPDGMATVKYRGASWTVVPAPGPEPSAGAHRIKEVVGSRFVVEKL